MGGSIYIGHMLNAAADWIMEEHKASVSEKETKKKKPGERPKKEKLSHGEIKKRQRERKRAERQIETTQDELEGFEIINEVLADNIPDGSRLAYTDRQKYFVVHLESQPQKWICRLHFNAKNSWHIEFPSEGKLEVKGIKDIAIHQERLVKALRRVAG